MREGPRSDHHVQINLTLSAAAHLDGQEKRKVYLEIDRGIGTGNVRRSLGRTARGTGRFASKEILERGKGEVWPFNGQKRESSLH